MDNKKKTPRSKVKYPALNPKYNLKTRTDLLDYDYIDKLSEEEKQWLNDFSSEYINANVGKQSEPEKNRFHNTQELVKDRQDANNARNRCVYTRAKAMGNVIDPVFDREPSKDYEEEIINQIDEETELEKSLNYSTNNSKNNRK